jgi:hypothetical protein
LTLETSAPPSLRPPLDSTEEERQLRLERLNAAKDSAQVIFDQKCAIVAEMNETIASPDLIIRDSMLLGGIKGQIFRLRQEEARFKQILSPQVEQDETYLLSVSPWTSIDYETEVTSSVHYNRQLGQQIKKLLSDNVHILMRDGVNYLTFTNVLERLENITALD